MTNILKGSLCTIIYMCLLVYNVHVCILYTCTCVYTEHCFCMLFHVSRDSLCPLLSAPSLRSRDASLLFNQKLFLQHCPSAEWPFFRHLFDTQLFCVFVEQRSFVHAESAALAFFDECTEKVRIKNACTYVVPEKKVI